MKVSIDSVNSLAIQAEYRHAHCRHADYLGSFQHPEHRDNADWTLHLYEICGALVFATNGDPVWKEYNHQMFDELLEIYGISIEDATADEYTEDGTLHDYQSGDFIRRATPQESADSIEAAKSDKGAGVILVNGRSCYVSS